jgi:hypothetical protein
MRTRGSTYGTRGSTHDNTFDEKEDDEQDEGATFEENPQDEVELTTRTGQDDKAGAATRSTGQVIVPQLAQGGTYSAVETAIDNILNVTTTTVEEEIKWQLGPNVRMRKLHNRQN